MAIDKDCRFIMMGKLSLLFRAAWLVKHFLTVCWWTWKNASWFKSRHGLLWGERAVPAGNPEEVTPVNSHKSHRTLFHWEHCIALCSTVFQSSLSFLHQFSGLLKQKLFALSFNLTGDPISSSMMCFTKDILILHVLTFYIFHMIYWKIYSINQPLF